MTAALDDRGDRVELPAPPRRVVSLVPSLTESIARSNHDILIGATDFCVHPAGLEVRRIGGSKYPRVPDIIGCAPDLVLANMEENRKEDVDALRTAGIAVWVTNPRTVIEAIDSLRRLLAFCGLGTPDWLAIADRSWMTSPRRDRPVPVVVPVWRRPWVVLGGDTFASDLLARLGYVNVFADEPQRYPRPTLAEIQTCGARLVVLPDEPYAFTADDGPECFPDQDCALVDGRTLTWYGPTLATAADVIGRQLQEMFRSSGPPGRSAD
ncbi:helical backbone metal receptor [Fodinicola acaciae]|uniref:helical backbone metal receptor n=1 Tax=Fodinicola acaciae TaxID=2681555 RepID=UPI0013D58987|nr:helical backbone metal receptor [Fodinicola acaciae]